MADLPPAVFALLSEQYSPDDLAQLRRGYDDLDYRFERSPEAHALKVCGICQRVYMWIEIKRAIRFSSVYRQGVTNMKESQTAARWKPEKAPPPGRRIGQEC